MADNPLTVPEPDLAVLRAWARDEGSAAARRARIVLLSADGCDVPEVAATVGCARRTVLTWRARYRAGGLDGLRDAPRSGRPATVDERTVMSRTLAAPRRGRWTTRSLAVDLGVSNGTVAGVWRAWGIRPADGGGVRFATRPPLEHGVGTPFALVSVSSLRVLAMVGEPGRTQGVAHAPDLLARLDQVAAAASPRLVDRDRALAEVVEVAAAPGARLLVDERAAAELPAHLPVHRTAAGTWTRSVQVAVALGSTDPAGVAAATDLAGALDRHLERPAGGFVWRRTVPVDALDTVVQ